MFSFILHEKYSGGTETEIYINGKGVVPFSYILPDVLDWTLTRNTIVLHTRSYEVPDEQKPTEPHSIDRRSVYDRYPCHSEIVQISDRIRRKTPSQYVMLTRVSVTNILILFKRRALQ